MKNLDHAVTGVRTAWCHRCRTFCADHAYLLPDVGVCDCCAASGLNPFTGEQTMPGAARW